MRSTRLRALALAATVILLVGLCSSPARADMAADIEFFSSLGDRSTGTQGCRDAAQYIEDRFEELGLEDTGTHHFSVPVLEHESSRIQVPGSGLEEPIHPLRGNAITPQTIAEPGLSGPLVWAGQGRMSDYNGKTVEGAVILMDLESGANWLNAAALGASALIYVDYGGTPRSRFEDKMELSPIQFPRFWMSIDQARRLFGRFEDAADGLAAPEINLVSSIRWQEAQPENIWALIPGTAPGLKDEQIVVEAFYDSTPTVPGLSPGADESLGAAVLLEIARRLKENPAPRAVLLVATAGHAQGQAGVREIFWSVRTRSTLLRRMSKRLEDVRDQTRKMMAALKGGIPTGDADPENAEVLPFGRVRPHQDRGGSGGAGTDAAAHGKRRPAGNQGPGRTAFHAAPDRLAGGSEEPGTG